MKQKRYTCGESRHACRHCTRVRDKHTNVNAALDPHHDLDHGLEYSTRMSAALDDIWDEPAIPSSTVTRRQLPVEDDDEDQEALPVKRRRATQPLFYDSDSDREAGPSKKASASKSKYKSRPDDDLDDLDAHFDGLDGDDDRPRTPVGNRADVHRSSSPLHAITSSSPTREDGAGRWKDDAGGEKGDGKEKKKRPLPKMDETRLLSEVGFPALIKKTKGFVPKGKGHEVSICSHVDLLLYAEMYHSKQI
jgi:replication fork protection complex subunit Csm3/Swi3